LIGSSCREGRSPAALIRRNLVKRLDLSDE